MDSTLDGTAAALLARYGRLTIGVPELMRELHYRSEKAFHNALSAGRLEGLHTYRLGRNRVCDIRDLARYLDSKRAA